MSEKTPYLQVPRLTLQFGAEGLWIKDESHNETKLWKDRQSAVIIDDMQRNHQDCTAVAIISNGNFGWSLAYFARKAGLDSVIFVPRHVDFRIIEMLETMATRVLTFDAEQFLDPNEMRRRCAAVGFSNVYIPDLASRRYTDAMAEIVREISGVHQPECLVVPFGSGEGMRGIAQGMAESLPNTELIAVTCQDPYADKLFTHFGCLDEVVRGLGQQAKMTIVKISKPEAQEVYEATRGILKNEPSSAVVFGAFLRLPRLVRQHVCLVNSGRGVVCGGV